MQKFQRNLGKNIHEYGRKKIALIANSTWNIYNFRRNVIRKFLDDGYEVVVLAPIDKYITYLDEFPAVRHLPLKWLNRSNRKPWQDVLSIWELFVLLRKERCDLILNYTIKPNIYGALVARLTGSFSIAVITGLGYAFVHKSLTTKIAKVLYRLTASWNQCFIFENRDDRLLFAQLGIVPLTRSVSIKGCGVDINYFAPNGVCPDRKGGKVVFTFMGRLLFDKGIQEFLEAAKLVKSKFPYAEFWLAGEIDHENPSSVDIEYLTQWVNSGFIKYWGHLEQVKQIIGYSDCIVLPSYREGNPKALTESMAMGKPVITTDTAGCREAVEEGRNGFKVPIKDINELAAAMIRFMDLSQAERDQMGNYGRIKAVREFDDFLIANEIAKVAEEVFVTADQKAALHVQPA